MEAKKLSADKKTPWSVEAKGLFYRAAIEGRTIPESEFKALVPGVPGVDGDVGLTMPRNLYNELIVEPMTQNPIRSICKVSDFQHLEESRLLFKIGLDAYDHISETAIANEVELLGDLVVYHPKNIRVMATAMDTVVHGTSTNLVEELERGLKSGLAGNEMSRLFAKNPDAEYAHMSFYSAENGIKTVTGATPQDAIMNALQDLPPAFRLNASIVMSQADWHELNKSAVFNVPLAEAFAASIVLCEACKSPIVGDFAFLRINYEEPTFFSRDKDAHKGEYYFILSASYDIRFRLTTAFRIAAMV